MGYKIANLDDFLETIGEDRTKSILANYLCPLNPDVERFLHQSAIPFARQGLSKTHLVFASKNDQWVLVGYFALAMKTFHIKRSGKLSETLRKRISKFARVIDESNTYEISAPLIAQLGKNFADGNDKLISGDELLKLACDRVKNIHSLLGGKIAYLECEDKDKLKKFYVRNGFVEFDKRPLDRADKALFKADYLLQMLRYF